MRLLDALIPTLLPMRAEYSLSILPLPVEVELRQAATSMLRLDRISLSSTMNGVGQLERSALMIGITTGRFLRIVMLNMVNGTVTTTVPMITSIALLW